MVRTCPKHMIATRAQSSCASSSACVVRTTDLPDWAVRTACHKERRACGGVSPTVMFRSTVGPEMGPSMKEFEARARASDCACGLLR